jgi:hypothetical protein
MNHYKALHLLARLKIELLSSSKLATPDKTLVRKQLSKIENIILDSITSTDMLSSQSVKDIKLFELQQLAGTGLDTLDDEPSSFNDVPINLVGVVIDGQSYFLEYLPTGYDLPIDDPKIAKEYVEDITINGDDWHMLTLSELVYLFDHGLLTTMGRQGVSFWTTDEHDEPFAPDRKVSGKAPVVMPIRRIYHKGL